MEEEKYDIKKFLLIKKVYTKLLKEKSNEKLNSAFAVFAEALDNHNFSSQQELSNFVGCNKAHTSRTLFKMQLKGLIKPQCKTIALTEKGKVFAQHVKKAKLLLKNQLFKNISKPEAEIFFKVLDQIVSNANEIEENRI